MSAPLPPRLVPLLHEMADDAAACRDDLLTVAIAFNSSIDLGEQLVNDALARVADRLFALRAECEMMLEQLQEPSDPLDRINHAGGRKEGENDADE